MVAVPIPISVTVTSPVQVALAVVSPSALSVAVTSPSVIAATIAAPSSVSVSVASPTAIALDLSEPEMVECEVVFGITQEERDKLASIEWFATRGPFDYLKMAQDARIVVGTGSEQELCSFKLQQPMFRESGELMFDATGVYSLNAGSIQGTFYLDTAPMPDATTGVLGAWTNVATFQTPLISTAAPGSGRWDMTLRVKAEALAGSAWTQLCVFEFGYEPTLVSSPRADGFQRIHTGISIDPSDSLYFRLGFSASVAAGKTFDAKRSGAGLRDPRDGSVT